MVLVLVLVRAGLLESYNRLGTVGSAAQQLKQAAAAQLTPAELSRLVQLLSFYHFTNITRFFVASLRCRALPAACSCLYHNAEPSSTIHAILAITAQSSSLPIPASVNTSQERRVSPIPTTAAIDDECRSTPACSTLHAAAATMPRNGRTRAAASPSASAAHSAPLAASVV